ncbi:MAG TPA: thioredoxin family protein [Galbitalea sp.]|jgi:thiol-disulfide isomerase/thioredoxin
MNPGIVAAIIVALVALSTALGLLWRARTGRVRAVDGHIVDLPEVPIGGKATLLQFSTEVCAPCVPTRRVLGEIATATEGVTHVDFDLTHRPDIAAQFNVLQTPTTFILDAYGTIRARIGGAPRPADVRAALDTILAA